VKQIWREKLTVACCVGALAAASLIGGCVVRGHGGYASVDIVDAHGYHHQGYYDDQHSWHGGWYDENHNYHDDPHDWHQ
jgi:hypothetical protein